LQICFSLQDSCTGSGGTAPSLTIVLIRSMKEENNLNVKSALWHFIGDLLNAIGVIGSAILIYFKNFKIIDPLISIVIGGVIFIGGAKIIRESYLLPFWKRYTSK
jgi:cobalt-zinc-cadmium efflux system protein